MSFVENGRVDILLALDCPHKTTVLAVRDITCIYTFIYTFMYTYILKVCALLDKLVAALGKNIIK